MVTRDEALKRYEAMNVTCNNCMKLLEAKSKSIGDKIRRMKAQDSEPQVMGDPIPTACELATQELILAIITHELACGPSV